MSSGQPIKDCQSTQNLSSPMRTPWPPILLVNAIVAASLLNWLIPLNWPGHDDIPARIVGLGIGAAGILLIVWAIYELLCARTTILPHRRTTALVTSGPFFYFRNPIYLGYVMIILGVAELTKNIWFVPAAILFAILLTFIAILPEERYLEKSFGEDYLAYKERTRRWI